MQKIVLVKSYFRPVFKEKTRKVPTGETKKGLFGGDKDVYRKEKQWEQAGYSDCQLDSERLAGDLEQAVAELKDEGYIVKSITPITSGDYSYEFQSQGISSSKRIFSETESVSGGASFGYGYGFSYTDSLILLAEKDS